MAWLLLAVASVAGCCTYDPYYSVQARASCTGADPARIRDVLETDPELDIARTFPRDDGVEFWCRREQIIVHVMASASKSVVRVAVGAGRRPSATEAPHWREQVEYVCERLSATCPEIGKWERSDSLGREIQWVCLISWLLAMGIPAAGVWLIVRAQRRKRAPVAT